MAKSPATAAIIFEFQAVGDDFSLSPPRFKATGFQPVVVYLKHNQSFVIVNNKNMKKDDNLSVFRTKFGKRLRKLRTAKDLSQSDFAKLLGYKGSASVSNIENGKTPPDIDVLIKIAHVLDADLHELITGEISPSAKAIELDRLKILSSRAKEMAQQLTVFLKERHRVVREMTSAQIKLDQTTDLEERNDLELLILDLKREIGATDQQLSMLCEDAPWLRESADRIIGKFKELDEGQANDIL